MIKIENTRPAFSDFRIRVQTGEIGRTLRGGEKMELTDLLVTPGEKITITPILPETKS